MESSDPKGKGRLRRGCLGCGVLTAIGMILLALSLWDTEVDSRSLMFRREYRLPIDDYCVLGLWQHYALACEVEPTAPGELTPSKYRRPVLSLLDLDRRPIASVLEVTLRQDLVAARVHCDTLFVLGPEDHESATLQAFRFQIGKEGVCVGQIPLPRKKVRRWRFRGDSLYLITSDGYLVELDISRPEHISVLRVLAINQTIGNGFLLSDIAFSDELAFLMGRNDLAVCDPVSFKPRHVLRNCFPGDRGSVAAVARPGFVYVATYSAGCYVVGVSSAGEARVLRRFGRPFMDNRPADIALLGSVLYVAREDAKAAYDVSRPERPRGLATGYEGPRFSVYVSSRYVAFSNEVYWGARCRNAGRRLVPSDVYPVPPGERHP